MATLSRDLRRQLEKTVAEARKIAEEGAEQSLHRLAVELPRPHDALKDDEKKLRVTLRAHAKQLGDRLDQRPGRLIQAVAYEHWHQLLFARFLIENDLLLHPEHGVALSFDELREIALRDNRAWVEVAADYAQRMLLRRVFQPDDPSLRVSLPPETRQQLEEKLNSLPAEVFLADDSLGWVYQFWQRDEKDRVNKAETKIGADELPAVTQLFTEDYMVLFLLENTLGAWWTAKRRAEGKNPSLPGYEWTYLRLNEDGSSASGTFDAWPRTAEELRVLDPCMGSGHFLVFALPILARMRMEEEGLSLRDALANVLKDNLFGLEIDARCAQIAAFNVALAAWRLAGGHFALPEMNLACSGLGINASEADWTRLAGEDGRAREEMRRLYSLFKDAPTLGSLIDPCRFEATLITSGAEKVLPLIEEALRQEQPDESRELAIAAQGVLAAFRILASRFTLVITNVPYLGRGKQDSALAKYCAAFHSDAKADLATCFVDRCLRFPAVGGSVALVTPQNWLFLPGYTEFRKRLLHTATVDVVVRLGANAFQDMNFWAATTALTTITASPPGVEHSILVIDASSSKDQSYKDGVLRSFVQDTWYRVAQATQLSNPDARIGIEHKPGRTSLSDLAKTPQGMKSGDDSRFKRYWWEVSVSDGRWRFLHGTPDITKPIDGFSFVLDFQSGESVFARPQGRSAWGHEGIVIKLMGGITAARYFGELFDSNVTALVPRRVEHLPALWCYVTSPEFETAVRSIEQSVKVNNATVGKVSFDPAHWQRVATEQYPDGLPQPYSADPTQWLFNGDPKGSDKPLHVAVARLVGYHWPRQVGRTFRNCYAIASDRLEPHAISDGIVALSSLGGNASAADRLRALLADAYGAEWSAAKLAELVGDCESLEVWLRDRFFEEHCEMFNQRPFVWHIWDGLIDGFHALVDYHKLDYKTLEKLIYSTLGDWISRQRQDVANEIEGAEARIAAAEHLQSELKLILEGEPPYDVFVRWKPLKEQPIGWNPDVNDGIRLNIRPWITAARLYRATKPGILRVTPKIKYGKDRGKEPVRDSTDFPWFKDSPDRKNDIHLTLEEKRKARGLA